MVVVLAAIWTGEAGAQTADEVIEKHLAAVGGRAALGKLESRTATGTVTVSVQGSDLAGPIEIVHKRPNKARTVFTVDLSQFGADSMVIEERFDGTMLFTSNSAQGDRELTGNRLENMKNATFPTPFLGYKEAGVKLELVGKETVGGRQAYVLSYTPRTGSASRQYFDSETHLLLRSVARVELQELGGEVENTTDLSDYRDVDGVKVPFVVSILNSQQSVRIAFDKVEHNKPIDDAIFARPAVK